MAHITLLALIALAPIASPQFSETARFDPDAGTSGDFFGAELALDGDTLVVGAWGADDVDPSTPTCISGAAYVYQRIGGAWVEQQRLIASDAACRVGFGNGVAISGDTIAIGAFWHDGGSINTNCDSGAVYIFTRNGTTWSEQQILVPIGSSCGREFGKKLALEGDTLVVGTIRDGALGTLAGAAFVFERNGATWSKVQLLNSLQNGPGDRFGSAVAISPELIVVGASNAGSSGQAYVFEKLGGVWAQQHQLETAIGSSYAFGSELAVSGNTIAIAATGGNATSKVCVFDYAAGAWNLSRCWSGPTLTTDPFSYFGGTIALDRDTLIVGEYGADHADPSDLSCLSGVAHVYTRTGPDLADWTLSQVLASTPECGENFGRGVALDRNTLISGAAAANGVAANTGVIYAFERDPVGSVVCLGIGCPCGNDDPDAGCANSTGIGAALFATGSSSVSAGDLRVRASGLPQNKLALFAIGVPRSSSPFGSGLRCFGNPALRYYAQLRSSGPGSAAVLNRPAANAGGLATVGSTVVFQCLYRDDAGGPCGIPANVTNALRITFTP